MANPQTENGWTMIADEIIEALMRINLSPYESRIIWAVIRQTYGWQKKGANISLSKFNELTGVSKSHICDAIKKLVKRNILVKKKNRYSLQKNYEKWQESLCSSKKE